MHVGEMAWKSLPRSSCVAPVDHCKGGNETFRWEGGREVALAEQVEQVAGTCSGSDEASERIGSKSFLKLVFSYRSEEVPPFFKGFS